MQSNTVFLHSLHLIDGYASLIIRKAPYTEILQFLSMKHDCMHESSTRDIKIGIQHH